MWSLLHQTGLLGRCQRVPWKCIITGNMYKLIKSVYSNCKYCIKTEKGITKQFSSITGVKQSCNLSPCMSNLYQNDLHNIFDETCDPTYLGTLKINSLSCADDLVIVSKSALGLQNCLNKLYLYCQKWGLNLNTQKTKCIEF